ncbi:MAG: hypothetical protein RLY31_2546 [Bacteroidota bacterium]|jgi:predicted transcriptional regulator
METKKATWLNFSQVESATHTLRAYKHRFRYDIINKLMTNGKMSSEEIASYLDLSEPYIAEQLEILLGQDLVQLEHAAGGTYFIANESKLRRIKDGLDAFFSDRD